MTSAPISASTIVQTGPERILERSTMNRSSSGFMFRIFLRPDVVTSVKPAPRWASKPRHEPINFVDRVKGLLKNASKSVTKSFFLGAQLARMRANPSVQKLAAQLLSADGLLMLVGGYKHGENRGSSTSIEAKARPIWKTKVYPVPSSSRSAFRWKASALRNLPRWAGGAAAVQPVTIMVPALYNFMPAESLAMGWLNEIDALVTIRQRMIGAAKLTGWDVFTFHTLHNLDHYYDSTIAAVRDTWVKEGNLSPEAILETRKNFAKPHDYHRVQARLVENLVF